ncbi:MAG: hypothetical protein AVDCRST_MAG14-879 [uncultured Rubrobacteraceae bacterium]|uniref:Uncharacterized protein n=1 Tax=uncultured Rubrobacteraceae bacterium TaxID=349277 RepID=A0A6J4QP73_9ACTN|nr:MAG: hypothetical protein AVDCRST_MAG14-879 [uncultured Rubrobacteraceae bacterium]
MLRATLSPAGCALAAGAVFPELRGINSKRHPEDEGVTEALLLPHSHRTGARLATELLYP